MSVPGTQTLPFRDNDNFQQTHSAEDDATDAHGVLEQASKHENNKDNIDPHGWLDPDNAITWLTHIAKALATADPGNAQQYEHNAEQADKALSALSARITNLLADQQDKPFVVFHDSYQYFESRFDLNAVATISPGDASRPGVRHISELRKELSRYDAACVFSEPQFNDKLINTVTQGLSTNTGILDPLGVNQVPGPELYPAMLHALATEFSRCFNQLSP
jgi:zinc transport system substrate-binding protein